MRPAGTFAYIVAEVIRDRLTFGDVNATAVAGHFGIHRRTLHRRLKADGTDFRMLAETVRFAVARDCLSARDLRVSEIALMLGYSEESAFIRAFRRWAGMAPGEWRDAHPRGSCEPGLGRRDAWLASDRR